MLIRLTGKHAFGPVQKSSEYERLMVVMNLPNLLTVIRFFLIPVFVFVYSSGSRIAAAAILAVSGLTDILDGYIARKYNMITKWGKAFDPVADKLTQITVAFCISLSGHTIMWFVFGFLVFKELIMVLGGIKLYKKSDVVIGANWYGKAATLIFYIVFFVLILFGRNLSELSKYMLATAAVALSIFAFIRYIILFLGIRKKFF